VLAQQIKVLQGASTTNAGELKALAEHLQAVVGTADEAATDAERQVSRRRRLLAAGMGASPISFVIAIAALVS
jgi:hypothetical protein